ncbi:helicase-associated domain-containing protein [Cohnella candidum]|uniref:Helicase XPB/Ssl2 N-terminal domain-containing protein n=1 Tax=Cohnella candidum TaxID=2674991 RepID=A0A3G3JUG4_9BACL|nr:helicase-associated domain-containing protein [Cohnella candidum]AYQ71883.1 hypothetical protein EAV92_04490 [Cohnella candidum]
MNAAPSVDKLPESIGAVIGAEPAVAVRLKRGMVLRDILSSPEWAEDWARQSDPTLKRLFACLLLRFGSTAFEEEKGAVEALKDGLHTGAEWRAGLARLRRAGVLFAIRKTWGDRLYYVPTDMAAVWQRLLLPANAEPLAAIESADVVPRPAPYRPTLALKLLSAWAFIGRKGLPLTAKGAISKPAAEKLASVMKIASEELAPLGLVYPQHDQQPAASALAVDLGLVTGVLKRMDGAIAVDAAGAAAWTANPIAFADAVLHRRILERYAASDPARHMAASAIADCRPDAWYRELEIARIGVRPIDVEVWLDLLAAFGWAEWGTIGNEGVFRLTVPLDISVFAAAEDETEPFHVQPDGEIYVPPGVGLAERWALEELAEPVSADRVYVYRLTKSAAERAYENGWPLERVRSFLERGSGMPVPGPVEDALRDWLRNLGKIRLEEAVLLRTDSAETASWLLEDAEIAGKLAERLGDRDFLVSRDALKGLEARLAKTGFKPSKPPAAPAEGTAASETADRNEASTEPGWIYCGTVLSFYEPDRSVVSDSELFPGLEQVPAAWFRKPGAYHATTRQELIRRAIGWRTALQLGDDEAEPDLFVPHSIDTHADSWEVRGRWKAREDQAGRGADTYETVSLPADRFGLVKIVLPQWDSPSVP